MTSRQNKIPQKKYAWLFFHFAVLTLVGAVLITGFSHPVYAQKNTEVTEEQANLVTSNSASANESNSAATPPAKNSLRSPARAKTVPFTFAPRPSAFTADNGDGTFTNPVINGDYPDCDVIRVGDDYYFISTSLHFSPGIPILHSKDLVNWRPIGFAIPRYDRDLLVPYGPRYDMDGGQRYGLGTWAPSIRYHNGTFYVLWFALNRSFYKPDVEGASYISRATNPVGPWTVNRIEGPILYDGSLLFDDDGKVYCFYDKGEIKCVELNKELTAVVGEPKVVYKGFEGTHAYKINGKYYTVEASGQNVVAYRSDSIWGPYERKKILGSDGVRQGGIVDTQTGEWWGIFFHERMPWGRVPQLVPVNWVDGWPMLGDNGKAVGRYRKPNVGKEYPPDRVVPSDDFHSDKLALQWFWNHNPDDSKWSLTERPGWIRLKTGAKARAWRDARNTLCQKLLTFPHTTITAKVDASNVKENEEAGMGLFAINSNCRLLLSRPKGILQLGYKDNSVKLEQNDVWLRVKITNTPEDYPLVQFSYSLDGKNYTDLGPREPMVDWASWAAPTPSLFSYSKVGDTGGWLDVDSFTYEE